MRIKDQPLSARGRRARSESIPASPTEILLQFGRVATEPEARTQILPLLAEASIAHVGADAAAVVEVHGEHVRVVAARGLTKDLIGWSADSETIGPELADLLMTASDEPFQHSTVHVMTSGGSLFGALVLLFRKAGPLGLKNAELADGLVDLAATALSTAARHEDLRVANAELRTSRDVLVRTEKLRALGQMAAGITHDLKNIISPMSMYLQLLTKLLDKGDVAESKEIVSEMRLIVQRGIETVERLRGFSQQTPETRFEPMDLNRLISEAADISKPRMSSRSGPLCRFVEELGDPPMVLGKSGEIVSAFVNLIVNAIDALKGGGTITLRTRAAPNGAEVEVSDNGPGMPPEVERHVFEPFFTTKGEEGTGLGLAMVYACIQRHGGRIALQTAPGQGTTFTVWFPAGAT